MSGAIVLQLSNMFVSNRLTRFELVFLNFAELNCSFKSLSGMHVTVLNVVYCTRCFSIILFSLSFVKSD